MKVRVWYRRPDKEYKSGMWDRVFDGVKSVSGLQGGTVEIKQDGKRQMIPESAVRRLEIIEDS